MCLKRGREISRDFFHVVWLKFDETPMGGRLSDVKHGDIRTREKKKICQLLLLPKQAGIRSA